VGEDWALHVSAESRYRFDELAATAGVTKGVGDEWAALTGRSIDATRVSALLTKHDEQTAAAAKLGSEGKYKDAIAQLDASDATIADARALADRLAATTDVSTLRAWIDRNADYDVALRVLYTALIESKARVNAEVRKAFDLEQQARAQLPGDTRAMVVIMSDIAQGGLNQAVIAIEEARGSLADALDIQQQLRDGSGIEPPG
jgi:sirohydrochlorin ferrochelatase